MKKVATLGEILMRLATPNKERILQAKNFDADYGGGEYNVAVSLSQFGVPTKFITALPDNAVGDAALYRIRGFGIDTTSILRQGDRLGLYFLEHGAAMRASKVVYDRAKSSISDIKTNTVDWQKAFSDIDWFHFTGITPALSKSAAEVTLEAAKAGVRSIRFAQYGMDEMVSQPTLIMAGEAGPERVQVTPTTRPSSQNGGGGITLNFNGPVTNKEFIRDTVIPEIQRVQNLGLA